MADDDIRRLEASVAALTREVDALRARLDETRATLDLTMRGHGRCRACGGRSILHAHKLLDRAHGDYAAMAVAVKSKWTGSVKGEIEAYICAACGLMEYYVKAPGELQPDDKVIARHEPPKPPDDDGSPYR